MSNFWVSEDIADNWILLDLDVLRKEVDLTGIPHSFVKVVFTYYFFDSWDDEYGFAGLLNAMDGFYFEHWNYKYDKDWGHLARRNHNLPAASGSQENGDFTTRAEMIVKNSGDQIFIVVGSNLNETFDNEGFAIGNVEIWVR